MEEEPNTEQNTSENKDQKALESEEIKDSESKGKNESKTAEEIRQEKLLLLQKLRAEHQEKSKKLAEFQRTDPRRLEKIRKFLKNALTKDVKKKQFKGKKSTPN